MFFINETVITIRRTVCDIFYSVLPFSAINSAKATEEYELARKKVASFINASDSTEIVFTRNATEAINLVAMSWGLQNLKQGDEVYFIFEYSLIA